MLAQTWSSWCGRWYGVERVALFSLDRGNGRFGCRLAERVGERRTEYADQSVQPRWGTSSLARVVLTWSMALAFGQMPIPLSMLDIAEGTGGRARAK